MNLLTAFVRSLGNARALSNAEGALAAWAQEDWLVQGLAHRLAQRDATRAEPAATQPLAPATAA